MKNHLIICALAMGALAMESKAVIYRGVDFPGGASSFADRVVSTTPGNPGASDVSFQDPTRVLGIPDYTGGSSGTGAFTLGSGGGIVVQFQDNLLTGDGTGAKDLHIFEVGPDVEDTFVAISVDGVNFISVGKVFGATSSIDIDPFIAATPNAVFRFVRLIDDPDEGGTTGKTPGADIDAVGAIATRPPTPDECMIASNGKKAQTNVVLARIGNDFVDLRMAFDGCVIEGYEYDLEFSGDLKNWVKILGPDASDFEQAADGRFILNFKMDGPLWQFIDVEKAKKYGHLRIRVTAPADPGE